MTKKILAFAAILSLFSLVRPFGKHPVPVQASVSPELPRVFINTAYPALSASRTVRNVKASCAASEGDCYASLQTAIDEAAPGDEIVVQAGLSITGPVTLRHKSGGDGVIVIRTANLSSLPSAGTRVSPAYAAQMPKILAPGSNLPALRTDDQASNYRLVGIEFAKINPAASTGDLVLIGNNTTQTSLAQVPQNITFDRIYSHGDSDSNLKRCLTLDAAYIAVIDSYIAECHVVGQDAQGLGGTNGPGPFKIVNNYIQASTENILFGGDVPKISGLNPSDIEIRGNFITKDPSWRNGPIHWAVKNALELKQAKRVLISGNTIEYSWLDGQVGYLVVLTPRNSGGSRNAGATWAEVSDVTIKDNIVRHGAGAVQFLGYDYFSNDGLDLAGSQQARNILISNNLFYDIGKAWAGAGSVPLVAMTDRPANIAFDHNTFDNAGGNDLSMGDKRSDGTYDTVLGLAFTNNAMFRTSYGFFGAGTSEGKTGFAAYAPDLVFQSNILASDVSVSSRYPAQACGSATCYPSTASWKSQFVDYNSALAGNVSSFALNGGSAYKNAGTDGKDIGADISEILAAVSEGGQAGGSSGASFQALTGDLNSDCIVNSLDWSMVNEQWLTSDPAADLNHDGIVNSLEWSVINSNWFRSC